MILFLLITLPIILIYFLHKNTKPVKTLLPPGPPRWPFIGNLHQLGGSGNILHVHLWQLSKKYGPIFHMKLGSVPLIVISSAKLAKEVLKTHDLSFCSRPNLLVPQKLSYNFSDIVFSSFNHSWKEVRKLTVTHLFSPTKIQSFRPIREDEIAIMVAKISGFATSNQVVNLSEVARVVSSNLICRVAFGKRYDEEGPEMQRFEKLLHDVQTLMATFFVSDFFPAFSWVDKLTGLINRLDVTCKNLDSFYQELIDEHLDPNRVKKVGEEEEDFLDMLIQIKEHKACPVDLTWDRIKALLMVIYILNSFNSFIIKISPSFIFISIHSLHFNYISLYVSVIFNCMLKLYYLHVSLLCPVALCN